MNCCISESLVSSYFSHFEVKQLKEKTDKEWCFKCLIMFVIMIKNYIVIIMNTDQIKVKLENGKYILMERRHGRGEIWKSFLEVQDAATNEKTGVIQRVKHQSVLRYHVTKIGSSHLSHQSCKFSASKSNTEIYIYIHHLQVQGTFKKLLKFVYKNTFLYLELTDYYSLQIVPLHSNAPLPPPFLLLEALFK
jgi:hypothetical protein